MKKILILFIIFTTVSFSQTKKILTIEECLNIGLENSKSLNISKLKVESAKAKTDESISNRLPALKLNASYSRLSEVDPFQITTPAGSFKISPTILDNYVVKLTLQQPLFTGFRLQNNQEINELNEQASIEDLNRDRSQLIYDIKLYYWNLSKAEQTLRSVDENILLLKEHLKNIENFYNNGLATLNDLLKVKVQLVNIELLKVDAKNSYRLSMLQLNSLIGLPLETEIEISTKPQVAKTETKKIEDLQNVALLERPELKSMDFRIKQSESAVSLANSGWYPQINFSANYYYSRPNQRIMPSRDEFLGTWDVGVNLSFDIWNWLTTKHQADQAKSNLGQSVYSYEQLKDVIILDVNQSILNLNKSEEKVDVAKLTLDQSEENYRVTNEKFNKGLAINSDLLDAENSLLQAKINYNNSIIDLLLAKAKLEKSIGK